MVVEAPLSCPPHHWIIEEPHGPTSLGKCKYCHEVREFNNGDAGGGTYRDFMDDLSRLAIGESVRVKRAEWKVGPNGEW